MVFQNLLNTAVKEGAAHGLIQKGQRFKMWVKCSAHNKKQPLLFLALSVVTGIMAFSLAIFYSATAPCSISNG